MPLVNEPVIHARVLYLTSCYVTSAVISAGPGEIAYFDAFPTLATRRAFSVIRLNHEDDRSIAIRSRQAREGMVHQAKLMGILEKIPQARRRRGRGGRNERKRMEREGTGEEIARPRSQIARRP